jgi:drug/metabolite transporter (DMT)-like permease
VPTPKVATYAYVNPIVAMFQGWLILHEAFDRHMQAGSIVIIAAFVLVTTAKVHSGERPETAGSHLPELEEVQSPYVVSSGA